MLNQPTLWDETRHALGVAAMDDTHREFLAQVEALKAAAADEFSLLFAAALAHTRLHFENENRLMLAFGFGARAEHEAEHARVLGEMNYFVQGLARGRIAMARAYVGSLPDWFANHVATMDAALAVCVKRSLST